MKIEIINTSFTREEQLLLKRLFIIRSIENLLNKQSVLDQEGFEFVMLSNKNAIQEFEKFLKTCIKEEKKELIDYSAFERL